jgi:two-component SAPR family response regulator
MPGGMFCVEPKFRRVEPVRILLLEDDAQLRTALSQVLELEGYGVVTAADGAEAVKKALDFPFELLIFDVKLPGPDGLEVLARFKEANPDLPSIVITGYASEADALRALRLGVGEYLEKPFNTNTLITAVKRLEKTVFQQRQSTQQVEVVLKLVVWSLEFLNSSQEASILKAAFSRKEAGRTAYRIASSQGYGEAASREVQAAVLLHLARQTPAEELEELSLLIPESVQALCDSLECGEAQEGLIQIGTLCLKLPHESTAWDDVRGLLGDPQTGGSLPTQDKQFRHLLSLGRGLSATGDTAGARTAFEVVKNNAPARDKGIALIELSRMAWMTGDGSQAVAHLKELMTVIPNLGPQTSMELELEAGSLSLAMGLEQGKVLLGRAKSRLQRLGLAGLEAQVELSLGLLSKHDQESCESAEACLSLPSLDFLIGASPWLLPLMANTHQATRNRPLSRLASRMARAAPRVTGELLESTKESSALIQLLETLRQGGLADQKEHLQRLVQKRLGPPSKLAAELLSETEDTRRKELRICSLGKVEVWLEDSLVPRKAWRTSRSLHLLARLAQAKGRAAHQDILTEDFWPGTTPERARRNLYQALTDLRRTLKAAGYEYAEQLVERKHDTVALAAELPVWHDLSAFHETLRKAKDAEENETIRVEISLLREATSLVRGELMEDCSLEWCEPVRRDFERLYCSGLLRLATCCAKADLAPEVEEVVLRLLDKDPYHQVAHRLLVEAYVANKRPELAIKHFEQVEVVLKNDLGIDPQTDLLRAYQIAKLAI